MAMLLTWHFKKARDLAVCLRRLFLYLAAAAAKFVGPLCNKVRDNTGVFLIFTFQGLRRKLGMHQILI
jgi:hypothetical protein